MPLSSPPPLSLARAVALWAMYVLVFSLFGGLGAGFMALLFQALALPFDPTFYAVVFGVTGFIAYQLARRVAER